LNINKYSEGETKEIVLINKKVQIGFKDLDSHIKTKIFNNERLTIKVIMEACCPVHCFSIGWWKMYNLYLKTTEKKNEWSLQSKIICC
jgi:hypothetical protein